MAECFLNRTSAPSGGGGGGNTTTTITMFDDGFALQLTTNYGAGKIYTLYFNPISGTDTYISYDSQEDYSGSTTLTVVQKGGETRVSFLPPSGTFSTGILIVPDANLGDLLIECNYAGFVIEQDLV